MKGKKVKPKLVCIKDRCCWRVDTGVGAVCFWGSCEYLRRKAEKYAVNYTPEPESVPEQPDKKAKIYPLNYSTDEIKMSVL